MTVFIPLFMALLPLYMFIALGFVSGKLFNIDAQPLSTLLIYMILPFVFVGGLWQAEFEWHNISIFFVMFALNSCVSVFSYYSYKYLYPGNTKNLMASGLPTGNTGGFGIPVALVIFDETLFGLYLLAGISNNIFQVTISYYILNLGKFDWRESVKKVFTLPILYAAFLGLFLSSAQVPIPEFFASFSGTLKSAFVALGMMVIGLTLSNFKDLRFDFKFISLAMVFRFMVWPFLALGLVFLDKTFFGAFLSDIHPIIIFVGFLPVASNFTVYAANINLYPARAAMVVFISTLLAAFIIPLVYTLS